MTRALGDELVILDAQSKVAHHLDPQAAAVWRACDGRSDADQIARRTGIEPARVAELLVQLCALDVLVGDPAADAAGPGTAELAETGETRRRVIGKLVGTGVGLGLGLPAITSIVLPTPAAAFTSIGKPPGGTGTGTVPGTPAVVPTNPTPTPTPSHPSPGSTRKPGSSKKTAHPKKKTRTPAGKSKTPSSVQPAATNTPVGSQSPVVLPGDSLPFTGDNLIEETVIALGAVGAGLAIRRKLDDKAP